MMGMPKQCFYWLLFELMKWGGLKNNHGFQGITALEKLGIYLYMSCTGASTSTVKNHFQHSSATISV